MAELDEATPGPDDLEDEIEALLEQPLQVLHQAEVEQGPVEVPLSRLAANRLLQRTPPAPPVVYSGQPQTGTRV